MTVQKKLRNLRFRPPVNWRKISTVDMHTGGEPLRIITGGYPALHGKTILEKRSDFREHYDDLRRVLIWEPRGHADMYGAVLTDPCSTEADFGTFFLHNEGYSTMCGHAIIAITKFVLDTKLITRRGDRPVLTIDAPPGQIISTAVRENGIVTSASFRNVPSFVLCLDRYVEVPGLGRVRYDVAFGGAFYAIVDAEQLEIPLEPAAAPRIIEEGMKIKKSVIKSQKIAHPFEPELSFLYGTIFTGRASHPSAHSRNVTIFANGELDRSATGSGVSARAALHFIRGDLKMGDKLTIESILGTTMEVELSGLTTFGPHKAVVPTVTGSAFFTGEHTFWIDPEDPLKDGFILR